ncbi:hypothetical protein SDC9_82865 [bioreactor metagenome]|uniref:DUF4342 domain-containing protein n=1 Tax=bioreactor metagenome TaxID=1076179 RepID=A0A644Z626_9ZZZZ
MNELKLIDKLRKKANISYEEAKIALESNNWDILEALLYLEENGSVEKPSVSIFYTNELRYSGAIQEVKNNKEYNYKASNGFQGIFEAICKFIDTCNNIFLEIKKRERVFLRIPITVVILLSFFMFWIIIPLIIIGLIFDIEFYVYANNVNADKINKVLNEISKYSRDIKEKIKRVIKND